MKIDCENLDEKSKKLYLSVIVLIKKKKKSIRKFLSLYLPLLQTDTGQNVWLAEQVEIHCSYGLLCLFHAAKSVYSFKPYFEEEWAEIWNFFNFFYFFNLKIEEAS